MNENIFWKKLACFFQDTGSNIHFLRTIFRLISKKKLVVQKSPLIEYNEQNKMKKKRKRDKKETVILELVLVFISFLSFSHTLYFSQYFRSVIILGTIDWMTIQLTRSMTGWPIKFSLNVHNCNGSLIIWWWCWWWCISSFNGCSLCMQCATWTIIIIIIIIIITIMMMMMILLRELRVVYPRMIKQTKKNFT